MFFERSNLIKRATMRILLLIALPCFTFALSDITYSFPENTLNITAIVQDGQTYQYVSLSGCPSYTEEIGAPYLPFKDISFVLPYDYRLEEVGIVSIDSTSQDCQYYIYPTQPPRITDGSPPSPFVPPDPYYYSEIYPGKVTQILSDGYRSGFRVATIRLFPIQYFEQRLTLYTSIKISLSLVPAEEIGIYALRRSKLGQELVERTIRNLVENPTDVPGFGPPTDVVSETSQPFDITSEPSLDGSVVDYVIITDTAFKSDFERLADWRLEQGFIPTIATTNNIAASYSGDDLPKKIREYIKAAYQYWGTTFVLLGGDVQYVPHRVCDTSYASDLYYSDLEGSWDENGNGIYGENFYSPDIRSIHFEDQSNGWLTHNYNNDPLGKGIHQTIDGGADWQSSYISEFELNHIAFATDMLGWAVGNKGMILKTTNGGNSWEELTESQRDTLITFYSVAFPTDSIGYAVGNTGVFPSLKAVIRKTTNSGDTWFALPAIDSVIDLRDVAFTNRMNGWVVGQISGGRGGSCILNITDGGLSWNVQDTRTRSFNHQAITFSDSSHGWVVGSGIADTILYTTNCGKTWEPQTISPETHLYDVCFIDTNTGWAVGSAGSIIKTTDGGVTWMVQSDSGNVLRSCTFIDANNGWIAGENGTILKTTDGGNLWIEDTLLIGDISDYEYHPDVWVGRAPAGNATQAKIFVDKTLSYEQNTPNDLLRKMLFMANDDTAAYMRGPMKKETLQVQTWFPTNLDTIVELYYPKDGPAWQGTGELTPESAIERINQGFHFINHFGHGRPDGLLAGNDYIYSSDVDTLINSCIFSILWTYGCYTNEFDYEDAISEHFLNNDGGGCVAFIGNSWLGIASIQWPQDYQFFKALFGDTLEYIGDAFSTTQGRPFSFDMSKTMNLLGDPALLVWTDTASTLIAEHPSFIPVEPCTFNVRVYSDSGITPLSGALVTLLEKANEIYEIDTTDENGLASFTLEEVKYSADMAVTVTKRLYRPYCGTCKIGITSNDSIATGYNQGNRIVRSPNTDWLHIAYHSDDIAFHTTSVNSGQNWSKPDTIDYGRYPAITLSTKYSYPWVFYFSDNDFRCAVQRPNYNWNTRTIFSCDSVDATEHIGPSLAMATLTVVNPGSRGDLGYGVFSDTRHIYFAAFDSIEIYRIDTLDIAGSGEIVSAPSISVTPKDLIHVVWQWKNSSMSRIYYKTTLDSIKPEQIRSGVRPRWSGKYRISTEPPQWQTEPASNPSVEAYGEYVYAAWRGPNQYGQFPGDVWKRRRWLGEPYNIWRIPVNESSTPSQESNYPVMSTDSVVVWQESLPNNWEIYCKIDDDTINLSKTEEASYFPHVNFKRVWHPGIPPDVGYFEEIIYSVFTEKREPDLYEVMFRRYQYSPQSEPPGGFLKVETGQETASVYCENRDGYLQLDNYAIDYKSDTLRYNIPYLNPNKYYLITARVIHDSTGNWKEKFLSESGTGRSVWYSSSEPEVLYFLIPPSDYQEDMQFNLQIEKMIGNYSALEDLAVTEVEIDTLENGGGIQSWYDEDLEVGNLTKLYHIAPNPFRRSGLIKYQLAQKSRVNLKIYDVMGRAVRILENGIKDEGVYDVRWDGKDNRKRTLAQGIYFVRLKTEDYTETKKAVLMK
jgi:photosystem II stability/assembly factor-like uncharacterized protein